MTATDAAHHVLIGDVTVTPALQTSCFLGAQLLLVCFCTLQLLGGNLVQALALCLDTRIAAANKLGLPVVSNSFKRMEWTLVVDRRDQTNTFRAQDSNCKLSTQEKRER